MSANETATIFYTTDGSTPTTASAAYSGPLTVDATTTLKYFGKDTAGNISTVQTQLYTINLPDMTAPDPVTNLTAGTPTSSGIPVTWTLSGSGDVDHYEVAYSADGSNYTVASAAINAASTSYTVTGLAASTSYTVRVVAVDGAGNRSAAATVVATTGNVQTGTVVVADDFNRADGSLGNTPTGNFAWNALGATIMSNQVGFATATGSYPNVDIAVSDNIDVELDVVWPTTATPGNISGVHARCSATNNQSMIFGIKVSGKAGFLTTLSGASAAPADVSLTLTVGQTYHIKLEVRGNIYKGYIDGALIGTYTDANNAGITNTKYGFCFYSTTATRGDNFKITKY
jgi:hypothetical protein